MFLVLHDFLISSKMSGEPSFEIRLSFSIFFRLFCVLLTPYCKVILIGMFHKQAGAELCQAQQSLSLDLDANNLGLITQPAVAGVRSLAERQFKIYLHKGMMWWMK